MIPDVDDTGGNGQSGSTTDWVYQRGVWLYRTAGWRGVLPVPPGKKTPPPAGFTGNDGGWPTDKQIAGWITSRPSSANLLLRLDYGAIGLDVDAHSGKTGARTLEEAEKRRGPLLPTWRSTSRLDDPISGVRVFQVPVGMRFKGAVAFKELGLGHIDIIQPHHRGIAAWPSIKDDRLTRWYDPDGNLAPEGVVPEFGDWPDLPDEWVEELSRDSLHEEVFDGSAPDRSRAARSRINHELYQRLIALDDNRSPDSLVASLLERARRGRSVSAREPTGCDAIQQQHQRHLTDLVGVGLDGEIVSQEFWPTAVYLSPSWPKSIEAQEVCAEVRDEMDEAKLIDKRDVSREYGIPVSTQEVLTAKGDFCPHLCVGKKWYYRRAELEAWLDAHRVVTTPSAREVVEAPAHDGDEFWRAGQGAKARAVAAGGEAP